MKLAQRPTRVTRILQAQERVTLAANHLSQLSYVDPRFANAINEYREALDARHAAEAMRKRLESRPK